MVAWSVFEPKSLAACIAIAVLWLAESWIPFYRHFRGGMKDRLRHDARNVALGVANVVLLAVLLGAVFALEESWGRESRVGLLRVVGWPVWLETTSALLVFDFWMYVWHRANHRLSFLWRFHRVHHSDAEVDCTTAVRFHSGEVLLSGCARLAVVPAIGMDLWQLGLYEAILMPVICVHHSNVRMPAFLDRGLAFLLVTPAVHRVHHSRLREETDSNYGSVLPWWDFLFGSLRLRADARAIDLGLDGFDAPRQQSLAGMLSTPFGQPAASAVADQERSPVDARR